MTDNAKTATAQELDQVLRQLADVLDGAADSPDDSSTPCTEFDLAALRTHVVGWLTAFTDGFADPGGRCSDAEEATVRGSGGDQVRELADRLADSLAGDRPEQLKIGESGMPSDMALQMMVWEYQMHGWDLAKATDQPWSPAESGVQASLDFAPNMLTDDFQGEGKSFAPRVEVARSAPALAKLAGLSGRDPEWTRA